MGVQEMISMRIFKMYYPEIPDVTIKGLLGQVSIKHPSLSIDTASYLLGYIAATKAIAAYYKNDPLDLLNTLDGYEPRHPSV